MIRKNAKNFKANPELTTAACSLNTGLSSTSQPDTRHRLPLRMPAHGGLPHQLHILADGHKAIPLGLQRRDQLRYLRGGGGQLVEGQNVRGHSMLFALLDDLN